MKWKKNMAIVCVILLVLLFQYMRGIYMNNLSLYLYLFSMQIKMGVQLK